MEGINETPYFLAKVRQVGNSLIMTLDNKIANFEGIKEGDMLKVIIKKLPNKNLEENKEPEG